MVISASANNVYHLKVASDNHWPEIIINHGFTNREFQEWVQQNKFFTKEDLHDVEYWTSCIPYELKLLLDAKLVMKPTATLEEVLEKYKQDRYKQLLAQQQVFYDEHVRNQKDEENALNAVTLMMLDISTSTYDQFVKLNQQLMFLESNCIYPITPLAKKVLISFWKELDSKMDKLTQLVFQSPVSEVSVDVKGRTLEKYIQHQIAKHKKIEWKIYKIDSEVKPSDWKREKISLADFSVIYFDGNKLPGKVNWMSPTLFIPTSPNYPDVDLFLWAPISKTLYPVQITLVDPISKHSRNFFEMKSTGQPDQLWIAKSNGAIHHIHFIWLGTNVNISSKLNRDYLLTLQDLDEHIFPLLKYLVAKHR